MKITKILTIIGGALIVVALLVLLGVREYAFYQMKNDMEAIAGHLGDRDKYHKVWFDAVSRQVAADKPAILSGDVSTRTSRNLIRSATHAIHEDARRRQRLHLCRLLCE